jgi:hypothetical protein
VVKFGVIPTTLLERIGVMTGKVPVPVLDALVGPLKARVVMTALSLGVFEAMREEGHTAADIAARCRLDPSALELLLRVLVVFDYAVQKANDRFALTAMARRTMLPDAPRSLVGYLTFNRVQWRFLAELDSLVRTGRGIDFHESMTDPLEWQSYQQAMLEFSRSDAPLLASRVAVPRGATSLLDLAGSHGMMGAAICRRHPPMRSTVIELPQAIAHARALARAEGIDDVVTHQEGDLLTADLGRDRDVVLLSQILHHFPPATVATILDRVGAALRPGGIVAIWDVEAPRSGTPATAGDIPALYFRLTSTARAFHGDDYAAWLRTAGFTRIRIARPALAPGQVLVTASADGPRQPAGQP